VKAVDETMAHNKEMALDFKRGEEGVDFIYKKDGQVGADEFNEAKLKREIKRELNQIRKKEPELAEQMAKDLLTNDSKIDKEFALDIPEDQIKIYPGSPKGMEPEDDPEFYAKWFFENQPEALKDENGMLVDAKGMGMKFKAVKGRTETQSTEKSKAQYVTRSEHNYFFEQDELYPMQNFDGKPEFELLNRENFNVGANEEYPRI
jgi:hypothetical protein